MKAWSRKASTYATALTKAVKTVADEPLYVFSTYAGVFLSNRPADFNREHFRINPDKTVIHWKMDCETRAVTETPVPYTNAA